MRRKLPAHMRPRAKRRAKAMLKVLPKPARPDLKPDCANPQCKLKVYEKTSSTGLCRICAADFRLTCLPSGGYIASDDLRRLAKELLTQVNSSKAEVVEAIKQARGQRHRIGPWTERPVYSHNLLAARRPKAGPTSRRMCHLLVGRRKSPDAATIVAAAAHFYLGQNVIGTGNEYNRWLVGSSYMLRRHLIRPKGEDGSIDGKRTTHNYRLDWQDYCVIGTHIRKIAIKLIGTAREFEEAVTVGYLKGVQEGRFKSPIVVPPRSQATVAAGDHPHDHFTPHKLWVPEHRNKIRRATGRIGGVWPEGLDLPWQSTQRKGT